MERKIQFLRQRRVSFLTIMVASCLFIAFVSPANAEWQNGNGDITYDFMGYLYIWDIGGSYSDSIEGINLDYVITQDASGKLTGTGTASASMYGVDLDMSFSVTGTLGTKDGAAWVKMTLKGKGTAWYEGESIKFSFSESVNAQVDPDSRTMTGTVKVKVSAQGQSESATTSFDELLPENMDGSAMLNFNCTSSGTKISGTGDMTLSNGESYGFSLSGKYNVKSDETNLTLKGNTKGSSLKLKVDGSDGHIKTLTGTMLGQKLVSNNIMPTNGDNQQGTPTDISTYSVQVGNPVCSSDGAGAIDGREFPGNTGYVDVEMDCPGSYNYMRVWLKVNTTGAPLLYGTWKILGWKNENPHGALDYYDKVENIDIVNGNYAVRIYGNTIRYASTTPLVLTDYFNETVSFTGWTEGGEFCTAIFTIYLRPNGWPVRGTPGGGTAHIETFYATGDTYVDDSLIDQNYGSAQGLSTGQINFGSHYTHYRAFAKFNVSSIPSSAQITEAKLYFVAGLNSVPCGYGSQASVEVSEVLSSWTEYGLTYINMPSQYKYIAAKTGLTFGDCSSHQYEIDVTEAVQDWVNQGAPNYGLSIKASDIQDHWGGDQDYCTIYSREVSQGAGPYLIIKSRY